MRHIYKAIDRFLHIVSGEFILDFGPNGGTTVVLRTALVSAFLYITMIFTKHILVFHALTSPRLASWIYDEILHNAKYLFAILGGSYTVFYTRYAAQWTYLAKLYNDIKKAEAQISNEPRHKDAMLDWKAGFIEDSAWLHLSTKPMFACIIRLWTKGNKELVTKYIKNSHDGEAGYYHLMTKVIEVCDGDH